MILKKQTKWLCTALLLLVGLGTKAQWTTVDTAGFSAGSSSYISTAFDSNDTLYIAFQDAGVSGKATVMKYDGSSWALVGSRGFSAGRADDINLAFDKNNTLYIGYKDGGNSYKATVQKYNGSSWSNAGSAGFSSGIASFVSLAIDTNGIPYVAYRDHNNSNKITVKKLNGSTWGNVGSIGFSTGYVGTISLAFDSNNTIYAAYTDYGNTGATVKKYNGSSWATVGSQAFSAGTPLYISLAFDSNDTAFVAYKDGGNSNKATVMKYNGSSWVNVGSAGFSASTADYTSLAIDANDNLYVAYKDAGNGSKATVMKFTGSIWTAVDIAGFSDSTAGYTSLAIDGSDNLYVAYQDAANSNKATVMEYIMPNTWNGSTWSKGNPTSSQNVEIASNTALGSSISCKDLIIDSGYTFNHGIQAKSIYGDLINNGNGISGTGEILFRGSDTATIIGDTLEYEGPIRILDGGTLVTSNKLRLLSNATNTGRIGECDGTISGDVMVQRYSSAKRCYRLYAHPFSSPIALSQLTDEIDITGTGGATNGFTTTQTNAASAYWFDARAADTSSTSVNSGWTAFTSTNGSGMNGWNPYQVLLLYLRGAKGEGLTGATYTPSASTFEAVGRVNQGQQVVPVDVGKYSIFAAVGNPYPSAIQMNTITLSPNVGSNYYAWDASSGTDGAYVTNAYTLPYLLPAYAGFFTNVLAFAPTFITFNESDKAAGGVALHKTTAPANWVELLISDSSTKWDRLLINLDDNAMDVEDKQDAKKLYNPNLDFYTLSKDGAHLAIDVRPYNDGAGIPLGLTAYNRYNRYVIKTGMFDIPVGTKLVLHDKYLNKTEELNAGAEYWFDVTTDTLSQGDQRFEINMVGKPTSIIEANNHKPKMQLIPNPAYKEVKVSFDKLDGNAHLKLMTVTGQVVYQTTTTTQTGSVTIPLQNVPAGIYIVELQGTNARFTEKLIKE